MNRYEACTMLARMKAGLIYPAIDGFSDEEKACQMLFNAWCKMNQFDERQQRKMYNAFPKEGKMEALIGFFNENQHSPLNLIAYDPQRHGPRQLISAACMTSNPAYETIAYIAYRLSKMTNSDWLEWIDDRSAAVLLMQMHIRINGTPYETAKRWMLHIDSESRNHKESETAPYYLAWKEVMSNKPVDPLKILTDFADRLSAPHHLLWQAIIYFTAKDVVVKKVKGLKDAYMAANSEF